MKFRTVLRHPYYKTRNTKADISRANARLLCYVLNLAPLKWTNITWACEWWDLAFQNTAKMSRKLLLLWLAMAILPTLSLEQNYIAFSAAEASGSCGRLPSRLAAPFALPFVLSLAVLAMQPLDAGNNSTNQYSLSVSYHRGQVVQGTGLPACREISDKFLRHIQGVFSLLLRSMYRRITMNRFRGALCNLWRVQHWLLFIPAATVAPERWQTHDDSHQNLHSRECFRFFDCRFAWLAIHSSRDLYFPCQHSLEWPRSNLSRRQSVQRLRLEKRFEETQGRLPWWEFCGPTNGRKTGSSAAEPWRVHCRSSACSSCCSSSSPDESSSAPSLSISSVSNPTNPSSSLSVRPNTSSKKSIFDRNFPLQNERLQTNRVKQLYLKFHALSKDAIGFSIYGKLAVLWVAETKQQKNTEKSVSGHGA